jgi:hypothetical protein
MHSLYLFVAVLAFVSVGCKGIDFHSCTPHDNDILDITVTEIKPDPPRIGNKFNVKVFHMSIFGREPICN